MKKLHLIRHAKSSWADPSLPDSERPLNQRGLKACRLMAPQIVKAGCQFEHIFCSPAQRAQSTIQQLTHHITEQNLRDQPLQWQTDNALYTFEVKALLAWCQSLDESVTEAVIVGHNSAMTDLINTVGDRPINNLPTCGYAQLAIPHSPWSALSAGCAELLSLLTPKMFTSLAADCYSQRDLT